MKDTNVKHLSFLIVLLLSASCATIKPVARTLVDVARTACEMFAVEQGVSIHDVCTTEEQLAPFVDSLLAAKQGVMGVEAPVPAPECPPAAPEAAPEPAAPPVAPAPVEEPAVAEED